MNLNEIRNKIKNVKEMLEDMVSAGEITIEQASIVAPVIIEITIKGESISGDYTPD